MTAEAVTKPRQAALETLRDVRSGTLADRALDARGVGLLPRDHAWVHELVYGTLRLRGRIDHLLEPLAKGGVEALEPDVADVLRLGLYQILEMGSVPPYAAISQSVELARWAGVARAAGLVNGVLQSFLRRRGELTFPDYSDDAAEHLTHWGSHPRWLVDRWLARWGPESTLRLVSANNERPELYLRPFGISAEQALDALAKGGVEAELAPVGRNSVRIPAPGTARVALERVPAIVQDPAASLVVDFAAIPDGSRAIDLCSAPGGKAIALADGAGYVLAADLSLRRLRRVKQNIDRLNLGERVGVAVADGRIPSFAPSDAVLVDAPCTGTGTFRRHPDARWRLKMQDLEALVSLQRELLDSAAAVIRPGGLLIYSTCSLEPEENEDQIEAFLLGHPNFTRSPATGAVDESLLSDRGDLMVLPQYTGVDGAYAARLRRTV